MQFPEVSSHPERLLGEARLVLTEGCRMMRPGGSVDVTELTPPGRGAIATLRVSGPGAVERIQPWVRTRSGRKLRNLPTDRPIVVRFGPEPAEEVILRCFSPSMVEIHCHGGRAAVARIQSLLCQSGCTPVDWKRWLSETSGHSLAKEALVCLAEAPTERTAGILLEQLHGALRREIQEILKEIADSQLWRAQQRLTRLIERWQVGRHLIHPWKLVLVGRPNVGKSSLINALVGYSRAIVHSQPGTTRDLVTTRTAFDGWPVELVDTAGWRPAADALEDVGIQMALQEARQADLVVLVTDLTQPWSEIDRALCQRFPMALIVHNKLDLLREQNICSTELCPSARSWRPTAGRFSFGTGPAEEASPASQPLRTRPPGVCVSALTGAGLPELIKAMVSRLVPDPPPPEVAIPFTHRHIEALEAACHALQKADLIGATQSLENLILY